MILQAGVRRTPRPGRVQYSLLAPMQAYRWNGLTITSLVELNLAPISLDLSDPIQWNDYATFSTQ